MIRKAHIAILAAAVAAITVLGSAPAQAQAAPYIQINNGPIEVNRNEQPFVTVQLGNRTQETITNVGVVCGWNGDIRVNFQTQNGPFGEPTLFTPPQTADTVNEGFAVFVWPNVVDLRPGQNFNAGFGLNLEAATEPTDVGQIGVLVCWTTDGAGVDAPRTAGSGATPVSLRDNGQANVAEGDPYIQINNGTISVTRNEQPFINVQLGNRGQGTLENVGVVCGWNGDVRVNFRTRNGRFGEPKLFTPPQTAGTVNEGFAVFVWPNAVDLRPGQNVNVGFGLNLKAATEPDFKGEAGVVVCWLTDGAGVNAPRIASTGQFPVIIR